MAVVLDILLEGESTWELIAELKRPAAHARHPGLGGHDGGQPAQGAGLGADDFCIKPVDRAWLLDRLHALAGPGAQEKVLLIDDDEVSRYLLKGLLADTRFDVLEAADGGEGLRLARQERPRAVFLDLDMPDLSGFEVLQALRAERDPPHPGHHPHVPGAGGRRARSAWPRGGGHPVQGGAFPRGGPGPAAGGPGQGRAGVAEHGGATMPEQPPATILIVDDTEASRYAVSRILRKARFAVHEAATGEDALRLAAEKPDLVILDVNLPDMSGYEVCRRIKADPATASIPVLHLSASFVESEDRSEGLESGADGYLTYPLEPRELIANVRALLRVREAEKAVRAAARAAARHPEQHRRRRGGDRRGGHGHFHQPGGPGADRLGRGRGRRQAAGRRLPHRQRGDRPRRPRTRWTR